MLDTKGPEIRTGNLEGGSVQLEAGQQVVLTTETITGTAQRFSISYQNIIDDLHIGDSILLDDGLIRLEVLELSAAGYPLPRFEFGPFVKSKRREHSRRCS